MATREVAVDGRDASRRRVLFGPVARVVLGVLVWVTLYWGNERVWDVVVFDLVGLDPQRLLGRSVQFFLYDTSKILLLITGLILVISLVRTALPMERIRDVILARSPVTAYVLAAAMGSLTPFCSCSSVPLFIGFAVAGVPFGVNLTFLITSPLINQIGVVMLAGLLGPGVAVVYVLTAMLLAIAAGATLSALGAERWVQPDLRAIGTRPVAAAMPVVMTPEERLADAWQETVRLLRSIWPYVVIGVGIGAGIHGWLPDDALTTSGLADSVLAVPAATLAGVPLYANVAGVVPLVEALYAKGVGIGTAMAFMMSVVALSVPSLILLRRVMMTRLLVIFTATVSLGIMIIGYLFDAIY
jgi:uncharacterized protein